MKTAIAMDYVVKYRAPDPKYWEGRHGCILAIRKDYHKMMKRRFVKKVLTEVHACILKGEVWFDPGRAHGGGAQALIPPGSKYERTVVNSLEKGASHKLAMEIVNRELEQDGKTPIGVSAVLYCQHRCKPRNTTVRSRSQTSRDANGRWARARHRLVAQLLIRLGEFDPSLADLKERGLVSAETTSIPACFDAEKLDPVSLDRIAFWDQTHKKQRVGFAKPQGGTIVQFPRNPETGELDLENGEYLDPPEETNLKYPSECRLCCGVWLNGRMRMFNYNNRRHRSARNFVLRCLVATRS